MADRFDSKVKVVNFDDLVTAMCASCLNPLKSAAKDAASAATDAAASEQQKNEQRKKNNEQEVASLLDQQQIIEKLSQKLNDINQEIINIGASSAILINAEEKRIEKEQEREKILADIAAAEEAIAQKRLQQNENIRKEYNEIGRDMRDMFDEIDGSFTDIEKTIERIGEISKKGDYGKKAANELSKDLIDQVYYSLETNAKKSGSALMYAVSKAFEGVKELSLKFQSIIGDFGKNIIGAVNPATYMNKMETFTGAGTISQTYDLKQVGMQIGELSGTSNKAAESLYNFDSSVAATGFQTSKYQKNVLELQRSGIKNLQSALDISKSQLFLEKQLGLEAGSLQGSFRDMKMDLMLSDVQISNLATSFSKIAKSAGLTGESMKRANDLTMESIKRFQEFRGTSQSGMENLQKLSAEAIKNGIQEPMKKLQASLAGRSYDMGEGADPKMIALRNMAAQYGGGSELLAKAVNGTIVNSQKDMAALAKGMKMDFENIAGVSVENIDKLTNEEKQLLNANLKANRGLSLDEYLKTIKSTDQGSMGAAAKQAELMKEQQKYKDELNKGNISDTRRKFLQSKVNDGDLDNKKEEIVQDQRLKQAKIFNEELIKSGGDTKAAMKALQDQFETADLALGGITNFDPKTIEKQLMDSNKALTEGLAEKAKKAGIKEVESGGEKYEVADILKMISSANKEERKKGFELYDALQQSISTQQLADKNPMEKFNKMMDEAKEKLLKQFIPVFEQIMTIVVPAFEILGKVLGKIIEIFGFLDKVTGGLMGKALGVGAIVGAFATFGMAVRSWWQSVKAFAAAVAKIGVTGPGGFGGAAAGGAGGGGVDLGGGGPHGGKPAAGAKPAAKGWRGKLAQAGGKTLDFAKAHGGKIAGGVGGTLMVANALGYDPVAMAAKGLGVSEETANTVSNVASYGSTAYGVGSELLAKQAATTATNTATNVATDAALKVGVQTTEKVAEKAATAGLAGTAAKVGGTMLKVGGKLLPGVGGLIAGGMEYAETGSVGRSVVKGGLATAGSAIGGLLTGGMGGQVVGDMIGGAVADGLNYLGLGTAIDKVGSAVGSLASGAWEGTKNLASGAWEGAKNVAGAVGSGLYNAGSGVLSGIGSVAGSVGSGLYNVGSGALSALSSGWNWLTGGGKTEEAAASAEKTSEKKLDVSQQMVDVLNQILDVLKTGSTAKSAALVGGTGSLASKAVSAVYDTGSSVGKFVKGAADSVMDSSFVKMMVPSTARLYNRFFKSPEAPASPAGEVVEAKPVGLNGYVGSPKSEMASSNGIVSAKIGTGSETDMDPVTKELSAQTLIATQQLATLRAIAGKMSVSSGDTGSETGSSYNSSFNRILNTTLPKGAMMYSTAAQSNSGAAGNPISYGL